MHTSLGLALATIYNADKTSSAIPLHTDCPSRTYSKKIDIPQLLSSRIQLHRRALHVRKRSTNGIRALCGGMSLIILRLPLGITFLVLASEQPHAHRRRELVVVSALSYTTHPPGCTSEPALTCAPRLFLGQDCSRRDGVACWWQSPIELIKRGGLTFGRTVDRRDC